jgi:hypothetical protein
MKYIILLAILMTLLFMQSCEKTAVDNFDPHISGKVIAGDLNGKLWQNTNFRIGFSGSCTKSISFDVTVYNEQRFKRESFTIKKIPLRESSFEIIRYNYGDLTANNNCLNDSTVNTNVVEAAYYTSQDDGHIGKDLYFVMNSPKEKNKLTVTKLDLQNKYIEGEFEATFLLKRDENGNKFYKDSADTLRFKGVKFQASIVNLM